MRRRGSRAARSAATTGRSTPRTAPGRSRPCVPVAAVAVSALMTLTAVNAGATGGAVVTDPAPETITEAELAEAIRHPDVFYHARCLPVDEQAAAIFEHALSRRAPRWKPGAYEDGEGNLHVRVHGLSAWLRVMDDGTTEVRPDSWVDSPVRRLVPEGSPLADSERDLIRAGLGKLLDLLGLGDYARPQSSHEVFLTCLEEVAKLKRRTNA